MDTFTAIICGECSEGRYVIHSMTHPAYRCVECGHIVSASDIDLDPGESLIMDESGCLAYVTR